MFNLPDGWLVYALSFFFGGGLVKLAHVVFTHIQARRELNQANDTAIRSELWNQVQTLGKQVTDIQEEMLRRDRDWSEKYARMNEEWSKKYSDLMQRYADVLTELKTIRLKHGIDGAESNSNTPNG